MNRKTPHGQKDLSKRWYVLYTKPRWEKKVAAGLQKIGVDSYCPLNKVRKQWSDRIKVVEEPLFKSYVFVHLAKEDQDLARSVNGALSYVCMEGKPAVVQDKEIVNIRLFLNDYQDISVEAINVEPNDKVVIRGGVLMNKEGTVVRVLKHTVELVIESLGYKMMAQIDKKNLMPIK